MLNFIGFIILFIGFFIAIKYALTLSIAMGGSFLFVCLCVFLAFMAAKKVLN